MRIYIRRPASKELGLKEEYFPVDPDSLHIGMLTELWMREERGSSRDGGFRFVRAHGVESAVSTGINPADLLERWSAIVVELEPVLGSEGQAKGFADKLRAALDDFPKVLELLAGGEIDSAAKALDAFGYGLIAAVATATADLLQLQAQANQSGDLAEQVTDLLSSGGGSGFLEATAETLSSAIDEALAAFGELEEEERKLGELQERITNRSQSWRAIGNPESIWLKEHLDWLNDLETGFCTRIDRHISGIKVEPASAIVASVEQAERRIAEIERRVGEVTEEHSKELRESNASLASLDNLERLLRQLRKAREEVHSLERRGLDAFATLQGLITEEEWSRWQELDADPRWLSAEGVRARFGRKTRVIRQMLGEPPQLSEQASKVIRFTRDRISELAGAPPTPPIQEVPVAAAVEPPESVTREGLSDDRAAELYELVVAIASVKYCGPAHMVMGTPISMLRILEQLGLITPTEGLLYREQLTARLMLESKEVTQGKLRKAAWQKTDPRQFLWIRFLQRRGRSKSLYTHWRLVAKAKPQGERLLARHGLTAKQVEDAHQTVRDLQRERHQTRIQAN